MKLDKLFLTVFSLCIANCALGFAAETADGGWRSIDQDAVPLWDEFVPTSRMTDYADAYNSGEDGAGEWNWWNLDDDYDDPNIAYERFWNPDVDYESFETLTTREQLDRRSMILSDTRSCPYEDTVACKEWLSKPHKVEALPNPVGYIPPAARKKTDAELEVEKLFKEKNTKKKDKGKLKLSENDSEWKDHPEFQGCPFETEKECKIWLAKPTVPETAAKRSPAMSASVENMVVLSRAGKEITTDMPEASALVNRYKSLLAASRACCTSGLIYNLRAAGASSALVYKFMVDDANFYQFGERCLMITDDELDNSYANTSTSEVVADIRNGCLCRQKEYFISLLAPFAAAAEASPAFASSDFEWHYKDGLARTITVSINHDVDTVIKQLSNCPD